MLLFKHGLYVVGRRLDDPKCGHTIPSGRPEIYAAERFVDAEHMRDHAFTVPADFRVARRDPVQQGARELRDGSRVAQIAATVRLSFTCANLAPVVSWVHEWGPHAKVISPPELRQVAVDELRETLAQYDNAPNDGASSQSSL